MQRPVTVRLVPTCVQRDPKRLTPEDLQRLLRSPAHVPKPPREWVPPVEYKLVAAHLGSPEASEAYIKRAEDWFQAHPPPPPKPERRREAPDIDAVVALHAKYGSRPPLEALARAGYSAEAVAKVKAHREWLAEHAEELQADIDRRWPCSVKTKTPSVIKAVKKKLV